MFSYPSTNTSSGSISNAEEFSFPVISNNPLSNVMLTSSSSSSSSLWRISSRVYHHPEDYYYEYNEGVNNNVDDYRMEVRSMCEEIMPSRREIERSASSVSFQSKDFEVEESMDYLWEDFNEEEKKEFKGRKSTSEDMSFMQVNKIGRKTSNGSSGTKLLVLGKLIKGLVSIRKSAQLKLSKARF